MRTSVEEGRIRHGRLMCVLVAALIGALFLLAIASNARAQTAEQEIDRDPQGAPYVAGELLVTYKEGVPAAATEDVPEEVEGRVEEEIPKLDTQLLTFPEVKEEPSEGEREAGLEEKKQELERNPTVETVEYNYIHQYSFTPNDPLFGRQYGLRKIKGPPAWNRTKGSGIKVAVVDSGVAQNHPDFEGKILTQRDFVNDDGVAEDDVGHGTHVAGTVSATTNNGEGVAGTCPGCRLLIAKAGDFQGLTAERIAQGIRWGADQGAKAINLSLGSIESSQTVEEAVDYAVDRGAVVVASSGNNGDGTGDRGDDTLVYPAAHENVMSVAATDRNDRRASFSNYGKVDVSAPGVDILSTYTSPRYEYSSGTSMSSPHVAGLAGLLAKQGLSNSQIRKRIETTAVDLGPKGKDRFYGHGRIDAAAAVGIRKRPDSKNTRPKIFDPRPKPGARTKDRTPTVRAKVRDRETDLRKSDISLFLDGRRIGSFRYDRGTDTLSYTPKGRLSAGRHLVRVVARDGDGLDTARKWGFKIKSARKQPSEAMIDFSDEGWILDLFPRVFPFDEIR